MIGISNSEALERSAQLFAESDYDELLASASVELGRPAKVPNLEVESSVLDRIKAMFSSFSDWILDENDDLLELDSEEFVNITGARASTKGLSRPVSDMNQVEFYSVYASQDAGTPGRTRLVHVQDFWSRQNAERAARDIARANGARFIGFRPISA
mgnify:CR=1 FL=1